MEVLPLRWEATLVVFLEIGAGARSNRVGLGLVIGTLGFGFSYNFFFLLYRPGIETQLLELGPVGQMGV